MKNRAFLHRAYTPGGVQRYTRRKSVHIMNFQRIRAPKNTAGKALEGGEGREVREEK